MVWWTTCFCHIKPNQTLSLPFLFMSLCAAVLPHSLSFFKTLFVSPDTLGLNTTTLEDMFRWDNLNHNAAPSPSWQTISVSRQAVSRGQAVARRCADQAGAGEKGRRKPLPRLSDLYPSRCAGCRRSAGCSRSRCAGCRPSAGCSRSRCAGCSRSAGCSRPRCAGCSRPAGCSRSHRELAVAGVTGSWL